MSNWEAWTVGLVTGLGVAAMAGMYCLCLRSEIRQLRRTQTEQWAEAAKEVARVNSMVTERERRHGGGGLSVPTSHLRVFQTVDNE